MKDRLKKRIPTLTESEAEYLAQLVESFGLNLTIKNLDEHGLILQDLKGRSVRPIFATWRSGSAHLKNPYADIVIIIIDGLIAGWIESERLEDAEDRFIVDLKLLHKMPTIFSFDRICPHLSVYGGILNDKFWECLGCGERIVH